MKKTKIWEEIIQIVYIIIAQLGLLFSFTETFDISYQERSVYIAVTVLAVLMFIVLKKARHGLLLLGGGIVLAEGAFLLWKRGTVFKEIKCIVEIVRTHMENYVKTGKIEHLYENSKFTLGILFFLILTTGVLACIIVKMKRAFGIMTVSLITFCIPFMAGEEPGIKTLICVGVTIITAGFAGGKGITGKDKIIVRRLGIAVGILSVIVGGLLFEPSIEKELGHTKKYKEDILSFLNRKKSDIFPGDRGVGGINGGKLGRVGKLEQDNTADLKVTVGKKPTQRMYLQGFIGENYTGHEWEEIEGYVETGRTYSLISYLGIFDYAMDTIEIEYIDVNKKYDYQPYGSSFYSSYNKMIGNKRTMNYYTYELLKTFPALEEWNKLKDVYGENLESKYTTVEREVIDNFSGQVESFIHGTDIDTVAQEIATLLDNRTDYSLNPGKTPVDRDFAEYFYFENRKGYCTHYATTAALLFRLKGIPARYVEGYAIEPDEFKKQKDGRYTAVATGRNAHAWAEVFYPEGSWLPVETTPGYTKNETPMEEENIDRETNGPTSQKNEQQKEENLEKQKKEKKEESKEEKKKEQTNMFPIVISAVGGVLIAAGISSVFLLKRKKKKRRRVTGFNEEIQELFHQIYRKLLRKKKITGNEELNQEFVEKICTAYPSISTEMGEQMLDIVYRANYGKDSLPKEDCMLLKRILLLLEKEK